MFSFSKKRPKYPSESRWAGLKGDRNGKPLIARLNSSAAQLAGHPDYVHRLGVAVRINRPNKHGFPSNEEMQELHAIEDLLVEHLEAGQEGINVLIATNAGFRDFWFYTRNPQTAESTMDMVKSAVKTHEIEFEIVEDSQWTLYAKYSKPGTAIQ